MPRARLIFTLLYAKGRFHLSRNFNLQAVGDLRWLLQNYEFESIARAIDELVILNVDREPANPSDFLETVQQLARGCFMPIAVGGGVRSMAQAETLFNGGADKIVLNSAYADAPDLVARVVDAYGAQSVVASIDFRRAPDGSTTTFVNCGARKTDHDLAAALRQAVDLGAGEVYLTSIDRDGTGDGYDREALKLAYESCSLPVIASGGADTYDRLAEGIHSGYAAAVSTAHLFNFMGDGLADARQGLIGEGITLSRWDFSSLRLTKEAQAG
jgi:imidazole glycerol-phosphate synthase subunit HisF